MKKIKGTEFQHCDNCLYLYNCDIDITSRNFDMTKCQKYRNECDSCKELHLALLALKEIEIFGKNNPELGHSCYLKAKNALEQIGINYENTIGEQ